MAKYTLEQLAKIYKECSYSRRGDKLHLDNLIEALENVQCGKEEVPREYYEVRNVVDLYSDVSSRESGLITKAWREGKIQNQKEEQLIRLALLVRDILRNSSNICYFKRSYTYAVDNILDMILICHGNELEKYRETLSNLYEPINNLTKYQHINSKILSILPKEQIYDIYGMKEASNTSCVSRYKISKPASEAIFDSLGSVECIEYIQDNYEAVMQYNSYYVLLAPLQSDRRYDDQDEIYTQLYTSKEENIKLHHLYRQHLALIDESLKNAIVCKGIVKNTATSHIKNFLTKLKNMYKEDAGSHLGELANEAKQLEDQSNYVAIKAIFPEVEEAEPNDDVVEGLREYLLYEDKEANEMVQAVGKLAALTEFINTASNEQFNKDVKIIKEFIYLNSSADYKYSIFKSSPYDLTSRKIECADRAIEVMKMILDVVETFISSRRMNIVKREFVVYYRDKGYYLGDEFNYFQKANVLLFQKMKMFEAISKDNFVLGKCVEVERHKMILKGLTKMELMYL